MARKQIYNQKNTKLLWNGLPLQGFADGTPITVEFIGGEVAITQGTDGGGLNIATVQGIHVSATFRETSPTIDTLNNSITLQQNLSSTSVLQLQTGANVKYTLTNALVSKPGSLSSGGKTQGSQQYDFFATEYVEA